MTIILRMKFLLLSSRRLALLLQCLFFCLFTGPVYASIVFIAEKEHDCRSLSHCLERVNEISKEGLNDDAFNGSETQSMSIRIASFGDSVIDQILPMLKHEEEVVVDIAVSVLIKLTTIEDRYFPEILAASETNETLILAIGRIDSQRATNEVVKQYLSSSGSHRLKALGYQKERALPFIYKLIDCDFGCDDEMYWHLIAAVSGVDVLEHAVVNQLVDQALEKGRTDEFILSTLVRINILDVHSERIEKKLIELLDLKPSLLPDIEKTLISIGSDFGANLVAKRIRNLDVGQHLLELIEPVQEYGYLEDSVLLKQKLMNFFKGDSSYLREVIGFYVYDESKATLAVLEVFKDSDGRVILFRDSVGIGSGGDGVSYKSLLKEVLNDTRAFVREKTSNVVGAAIVSLLSSTDSEIRLLAIEALGRIKYEGAVNEIIPFLHDGVDIHATNAAVHALGKLGFSSAKADLAMIAKEHWYPPIRNKAKLSMLEIDGETDFGDLLENSFFDHYEFSDCELPHSQQLHNGKDIKLYSESDKDKLIKHSFDKEAVHYVDSSTVEGQKIMNSFAVNKKAKSSFINDSVIVEIKEPQTQVPSVALKVGDGWLLGSDKREFSGDLVHSDPEGNITYLLEGNVQNIVKLGDKNVVVINVPHLDHFDGMVYDVYVDQSQWKAKLWRTLPSAASRVGFIETGELLIDTDTGSALLSESGSLRIAECHE